MFWPVNLFQSLICAAPGDQSLGTPGIFKALLRRTTGINMFNEVSLRYSCLEKRSQALRGAAYLVVIAYRLA